MLYPLTFKPIFKERIWGGRNIERLYQKSLPPDVAIGESWEISDRPGDETLIANGAFAGKSLRWLMQNHERDLLGQARPATSGRFPLLIKILDAQEKLSLQVHPPADKAAQLGGEPKTEMWYIADATPDADLFVGLKRGVTRAEFERRIADGSVAECFHHLPVKKGDAMFLPSGRVHAIGAGNVIFEIQQNSDTTYRVFDWNRTDASGKPRDLHVAQSLESIDFNDVEPPLLHTNSETPRQSLVRDSLFSVDFCVMGNGEKMSATPRTMQILGVVAGTVAVTHQGRELSLKPGEFCLIPAELADVELRAGKSATFLHVRAG